MKSLQSLNTQFLFLFLFHLQCFQASSSLSLSSNSSFSSSVVPCSYEQRHALLQFKNSFSIDTSASDGDSLYVYPRAYPKTKSWKEGTDCCLWDGVTCDLETGYVIGLNLSSSMLHGTLDSNNSLFFLSHLRKLDLSNNDFNYSNISSQFGGLLNLTHLNLNSSNFVGQVPSEISHLSNLVSLDLSLNNLNIETTAFNEIIQNLAKLRELIFNEVDMSMVAPTSFMNLSSSLSSLKLRFCGLPEKFLEYVNLPNGLVSLDLSLNFGLRSDTTAFVKLVKNLTKLKELDLTEVNMSLVSPTSLMNLSSSLSSLKLVNCGLRGEFPGILFQRPSIQWLDLYGNVNLTGFLPGFNWSSSLQSLNLSETKLTINLKVDFTSNLRFLKALEISSCNFIGSNLALFGNLTQLTHLDLSYNNFNSEIPPSFTNLKQLSYLLLYINNLRGPLPTYFSNFTQLIHLDLSSNNFSGEIPLSFGNLHRLTWLDLSNNSFSGEIPPSFENLQLLTELYLSNNNFNGEIPLSFGNLRQLTWLDLSANNLSGEIPSSFTNLIQLAHLNLSYNRLTDPDPIYFSNFTQLESLYLQNNRMIGPISSQIGRLSSLRNLDLSNNLFNGTIPSSLFTLPYLEALSLKNNQLHGRVGDFQSKSLSYIDLSNNKLHGRIPISIFNLVQLEVLILSSNFNLMGHVPSSICELPFLKILDLSNNSFSGVIPKCLGDFSDSLVVLHLGMNYFNGTIPPTFSEYSSLRYINFYSNKLQGKVPSSIINCRSLEFLDLSNNEIDDTFPFFLGALPELQVLVLRFNKFHGFMNSFSLNNPFPKLRIFDVSNNKLSGPLPVKYFNHFQAMMSSVDSMTYMRVRAYMGEFDYSVRLTFKGSEIEMVKIQSLLTTIDVSCNNFTGSIPPSIGMLKLLNLFNMSHNCITGNIQSSLGNLTNLKSLDLSSNLLAGRIPDELAKITFLQVFNVSYNLLEGPIPGGNQFNTFDVSSYEGNLGLCGFPLGKDCNNGESQQLIPPDEEYSKSENGFGWEAVLIGYGCGVLFGLTIGYVVFKTRKYSWFARMVEVEGYVWRKKFDKIKNSRKPHRRRN